MLWRKSKQRPLPPGFVAPCIPTVAAKVPSGPLWVHEVKQDGYRMMARRDDAGAHLLTRNGFDWTERYPRIAAALGRLPVKSATIDGEAVWLSDSGIADFMKLHSRTADREVCLVAFDLLELNGEDLRKRPLEGRHQLLKFALEGVEDIQLSEYFAGGGEALFKQACTFGLEGIVSKRRDHPYQSGRSTSWLKIKNPDSPAMRRLVTREEV
jgi:bifunctional non-homologous end joining protein LigD